MKTDLVKSTTSSILRRVSQDVLVRALQSSFYTSFYSLFWPHRIYGSSKLSSPILALCLSQIRLPQSHQRNHEMQAGRGRRRTILLRLEMEQHHHKAQATSTEEQSAVVVIVLQMAWRASTNVTSLNVRLTVYQDGVPAATFGSRIAVITAAKLIAVFTRWIITVRGTFSAHSWHSEVVILETSVLRNGCRAGGIISETSFKFFIQFCVYATIYAVYNLVVVAYFFAEGRQRQGVSFRLRSIFSANQNLL